MRSYFKNVFFLISEDSERSKKRNRFLLPSGAGIKGYNTPPLCGASTKSASQRIGVYGSALRLIPFILLAIVLSGCSNYQPPSSYTRPFLGAAQAPITIIEYSDFQCPACQAAVPVVSQVVEKYGDKVHFEFHHFPLPMHELAYKAAIAAECAADQGKFWLYYERLFKEQPNFQKDQLIKYAADLNLNTELFTQCLGAPDPAKRVQADLNKARELNLPGTPSFFLNGRAVENWSQLPQLIELELMNLGLVVSGTS